MLELYRKGKTDAQVADIVGVSVRTIHNWKGKNPLFFHSLKDAKQVADDLVEASLFSRATGYSHKSEEIFCYFGKVKRVPTVKQYAPDVTAAIFWLKNRQPDRWRDQVPASTTVTGVAGGELAKKRTFTEFAIAAGYPPPYAKQIEMVDFLITIIDPRLLLGSRGYGKTDYITILGVAYDIYMNEDHTWMILTKEKKRSSAIIVEVASALKANDVKLEKENSSCIRVLGHGGKDHSVDARSIRSGLRGPHPYGIVMDDPVTEEDVSEATRAMVERKYNEAFKLTSNILIIGQPAHQHDLYAKLRPLLKNKMEVPHGTIPELDHDLEAQRLAGVDEKSIQASYHLKIISDGSAPFEKINYIDSYPVGDSVAFLDPSHKGVDFTALTIGRMHFQGFAAVGFVWKKAWNHCLDDLVLKLKAYGVKKLCVETNGLGTQPVDMIHQLSAAHRLGIGVVGKDSTIQKHAKIMAAGSYAHLIHLSKQSDRAYTDQVVQYEYKAKNDDAPDSLASLLEWIGLIRGK